MLFLSLAVQSQWQLPAAWLEQATRLHPDDPLHVFSLRSFIRGSALLLGVTSGASVLCYLRQFSECRPSLPAALFRIVAGLAVGLGLWLASGELVSHSLVSALPGVVPLLLEFSRGLSFGLWLALLWPLLYCRLEAICKR